MAGYDPGALVAAQQVHGTEIAVVTRADHGRGAYSWESAIPDTDGLIIAESGVPVAIQVADCAPVLIVDPAHRALAVLHAGWRGAVGGIAGIAVRRLMQEFGADPAVLLAGIGPTLCTACLEVGEETATQAPPGTVIRKGFTKPHLDLRAIITADLHTAGMPWTRIIHHTACTRCQTDHFFSHRGQQGQAGRFALVAWWEEGNG